MTSTTPLISRTGSRNHAGQTIIITRAIAQEPRHGALAHAAAAVLSVTAYAWASHEQAAPSRNRRAPRHATRTEPEPRTRL